MFRSFFTCISVLTFVFSAFGQIKQVSSIEESKLYTKVADIELVSSKGTVQLSEIYGKSPVLIAPIFSRCSGICSPFLKNLSKALQGASNAKHVKILVISFDPRDGLKEMNELAKLQGLAQADNWIFAYSPDYKVLNRSLDFQPIWNEQVQQFEHEALLVGVNENGYIVRKQVGMRDFTDLNSILVELNKGFVSAYPLKQKNRLFTCFTYNPATGETSFSLGLLVMLIPAIITLLFILYLAFFRKIKEA